MEYKENKILLADGDVAEIDSRFIIYDGKYYLTCDADMVKPLRVLTPKYYNKLMLNHLPLLDIYNLGFMKIIKIWWYMKTKHYLPPEIIKEWENDSLLQK